MYDEAMAAVESDKHFWDQLQSAETKFLWWPQYNALTGRRMWLCHAVCAISGTEIPELKQHGITFTTIRWYKPRDFVVEQLSK